MSKFTRDADETRKRIYRGLIVQEYGPEDVDLLDYLGRRWECGGA